MRDGGLGEDVDAEGDLVGLEVVAVLDARGEGGEVVGHLHVCNSDAFRVSEMDSEQIEKAPLFYRGGGTRR